MMGSILVQQRMSLVQTPRESHFMFKVSKAWKVCSCIHHSGLAWISYALSFFVLYSTQAYSMDYFSSAIISKKVIPLNSKSFSNCLLIAFLSFCVLARPVITTSTPLATNVPGAVGELVTLSCIAKAKPPPKMSWKTDLNEVDLKPSNDGKVTQINAQVDTIELKVKPTSLNEVFYCVAVNLLGSDSQIYRIRERGELMATTTMINGADCDT